MSLYPHHRAGPHETIAEAFERGVKVGAEQERARLHWTPNTNAQGLAVAEAIKAAKEEGRREERARIEGRITACAILGPLSAAVLLAFIDGKGPAT